MSCWYFPLYSFIRTYNSLFLLNNIEIEKLSTKSSTHAKTVMELTGKEYPFLAVIFAMMMYLIVFIVELIRPWKQDIHNAFSLTSLDIHSYAWSPIVYSY